ncbi:hypothetical protein CDL15_Pgr006762 [Punica granatum]|uniref:EF-hand domain-containing protein n=1 Tax=Punica granatum TaxID=22663 RepID=A0A218X8M7_PUNGR|nr:hypothetical protein CDL15_Pgr006762 [Punica granatum]PKI50646.1 hypothetical protein CRG98_028958 [Punica granatum]
MGHPKNLPESVAAAVMKKKIIKDHFRKFDQNGDGKLSLRELAMAFDRLGSTAPALRAIFAILKVDENHDGYISGHELDKLVEYVVERGYPVNDSLLN